MMTRKFVHEDDLRHIRRELVQEETFFTASAHTISVPALQTSYTNSKVVEPWPDLQDQVVPMTPGQAARTELLREYPDLEKVGWRGTAIRLLDKRVPLHYSGTARGEMIYIDLVGAYTQIYSRLWLDTPYPFGYYGRYPLRYVAGRLGEWKAARNAVVGLSRMRTIVGVRGGKTTILQISNRFLAPGLWGTVMDWLHWVAGIALDCGCFYCHTDGYLFKDMHKADDFMTVLSLLGIDYSIRGQGDGHVSGWNSYKVGKKLTKSYELGLNQSHKEFSNVKRQSNKWGKYWRNIDRIIQFGELRGPSDPAGRPGSPR